MDRSRRQVLQGTGGMAVMGLAVTAGLFKPGSAWAQAGAWNKAAFDTKNMNDTVKALGGTGATESKDIVINSPDIAENGAVLGDASRTVLWAPKPGRHELTLEDEGGRTVDRVRFSVR